MAANRGKLNRADRGQPEKHDQILQGALRTFLQQGYVAASMDKIAAEAGVSKQTIYSHFDDKETLFVSLIQQIVGKITQSGFNQELFELEPYAFLTRVANIFLSKCDDWEFVSFLRLVTGESGRFPELAQLYVRNGIVPAHQAVTYYFAKRLKWSDPEAAARIFMGAIFNYITSHEILHGKHIMVMPRERFMKTLVEMMLEPGTKTPSATDDTQDFSPPSPPPIVTDL